MQAPKIIIKYFVAISSLCLSFTKSWSQNKSTSLIVVSYTDTIINETSSAVHLKLINTSDTSIVISDRFSFYGIAIHADKNREDTIDTKKITEHSDIDFFAPERFEELKPGQSKDFSFSFLGWIAKKGLLKEKFYINLNKLNKQFDNPETTWITQYFKFDYADYFRAP